MDELLRATHEAEREHFWYRGFRLFVEPFLAQATKGLSHPRILDCGCGTGANLPALEKHGLAFGFDLTWTGVTYAAAAGHRRIACATADRYGCENPSTSTSDPNHCIVRAATSPTA